MMEVREYNVCLRCGKEYPLDIHTCMCGNNNLWKCTDEIEYSLNEKRKWFRSK